MRQAVVAGVLASLIVMIFIEPILTWMWGLISESSINYWQNFVDSAYANASFGRRSISSIFILSLFVELLSGAIIVVIFKPLLKPWIIKRFGGVKNDEERENKLSKLNKVLLFIRVTNIFLGIFLVVILFRFLMVAFIDFQLNSSFERRIASLTPVITDQQYKELRARWATMKNHKDYIDIREKMNSLANEKHLVIPNNLLGE